MHDDRPAEAERRDDDVHPRPVRQAGVHHRRGLIDPPADAGDDAVDHLADVVVVAEPHVGQLEHPPPLGVHLAGAVHQDVGDAGLGEQRFERTVPEDLVEQFAAHPLVLAARHRRRLALQHLADDRLDFGPLLLGGEVVQPADVDGLDDAAPHLALVLVEGDGGCQADRRVGRWGVGLRRLNWLPATPAGREVSTGHRANRCVEIQL